MIRKLLVAGMATAAAVATAGGVAVAGGGAARPLDQNGAPATPAAPRHAAVTFSGCDGGAQKYVRTRQSNAPVVFGKGSTVILPGAVVPLTGPVFGRDTVNVTFSAESQLRGSDPADHFDWTQLEVLLDGVPLQPSDSFSPMALTGSPDYAMTAAQFCGYIGPGRHTLAARVHIVDNGHVDPLQAWIDDYALKAEVSD